uniref:Uncharacterized protein n=1 Tax=Ditylenchus dipsaci TaxID=166011 RepID=A0A915CXV2_9BILA
MLQTNACGLNSSTVLLDNFNLSSYIGNRLFDFKSSQQLNSTDKVKECNLGALCTGFDLVFKNKTVAFAVESKRDVSGLRNVLYEMFGLNTPPKMMDSNVNCTEIPLSIPSVNPEDDIYYKLVVNTPRTTETTKWVESNLWQVIEQAFGINNTDNSQQLVLESNPENR